MSRKKPLKGHSPQAYPRDVKKFGELLNKCPHVSYAGPGAYCNVGGRGYHVTFEPHTTPNMLCAYFQDGQGKYSWHIAVKEISIYECAQEIAAKIHTWKPKIIPVYRGFPSAERDEPMAEINDAAPLQSEDPQHCQDGQIKDGMLPDTVQHPDSDCRAETGEECKPDFTVPYNWIPIDSYVYYALETRARESQNYTVDVFSTHANFVANGLHQDIRSRTGITNNKQITKALQRLHKAGIWKENDGNSDYRFKLRFVKDVPIFSMQTEASQSDLPLEPLILTSQTNGALAARPASSIQKDVVAAVLQTITAQYAPLRSAHEEITAAYGRIMQEAAEHNDIIERFIAAFGDGLTPEDVLALREKMIG